jgi:hypothetical protein
VQLSPSCSVARSTMLGHASTPHHPNESCDECWPGINPYPKCSLELLISHLTEAFDVYGSTTHGVNDALVINLLCLVSYAVEAAYAQDFAQTRQVQRDVMQALLRCAREIGETSRRPAI